MKTRMLAGTELFCIGYGPMALSIENRPPLAAAQEAFRALEKTPINFVDTAISYCTDHNDFGHNERLLRDHLLKNGAGRYKIGTKGGTFRPNGEWIVDNSPGKLRESFLQSLENLGVPSVFLYQVHAPDKKLPIKDYLEVLIELKEKGAVKAIGVSNFSLEQLEEALEIAPIDSVQNQLSLFAPGDLRNGVVELCERRGVLYIAHSPLGGILQHKNLHIQESVRRIAQGLGWSTYKLALVWLLKKSQVILPVVGSAQAKHVEEIPAWADAELDEDISSQVDELARLC